MAVTVARVTPPNNAAPWRNANNPVAFAQQQARRLVQKFR
jgi:hypothetical protein